MEPENLQPKITKEFLEKTLGYAIDSFSLEAGSKPGDNYMSNIFGVNVSKKSEPSEKIHLVVKCFPNHPGRQDFLQKGNIFSKEVSVYTQWVTTLQKFQEDILKLKGVPLLDIPFPAFISGHAIDYQNEDSKDSANHSSNPNDLQNYLMFEDLRKTDNYKMADRIHGLDVHHCTLVIKELAKVHALSWCYKVKNNIEFLPKKFPFLRDSMFDSQFESDFEGMVEPVVNQALNQIESAFKGKGEEYLAAKQFFQKDFTQMGRMFVTETGIDEDLVEDVFRVKPVNKIENKDPWMVVCHGDCWVNNFLFKYDETTGHPTQLKLVDLQMCREGCPTVDLAYFFYSSTTADVRNQHLENLLRLYHDEFIGHCKVFKTPVPPGFDYKTLRRRFQRSKIFGFYMSIFLLQLVLQPPEDAKDLDYEDHDKGAAEVFSSMMMSDSSNSNTNLQGRLKEIVLEMFTEGVI